MSVLFDGQTVIRPQTRVRIDAAGLNPVVLGSANVIMAFGNCEGGEPNKVLSFASPQDAIAVLRSGALLDAIKRMWAASDELPGASTIKVVRVDPALKSSLTLEDGAAVDLLTITSKDWGAHTTGITVTVAAGSVSGKKITIIKAADNITEVFDNLATVAAAVAAINNPVTGSSIVDAALVLEGTLANISATALAGGTNGTTTNTEWTNAFTLLDSDPADIYHPATSDASVHALLVAQVNLTSQNKRGGIVVLGHALGLTKDQVSALAEVYAANQGRVVMCSPGLKDFDANGAVQTYASYASTAPKVAGIIAGLAIQRAATFKTISGLGLEKDYTQAELDDLEVNGVLSIENVQNRGLRVVHGQTTWTGSLNPTFREISVRRIADLISLTLKQGMEEFVGEPGSVFTISAIKAKVEGIMKEARDVGLITDGVDNAGNPQPAFRNIVVKFNSASGICYVEVEASPVTPINYVLVTAHFRATNIVA